MTDSIESRVDVQFLTHARNLCDQIEKFQIEVQEQPEMEIAILGLLYTGKLLWEYGYKSSLVDLQGDKKLLRSDLEDKGFYVLSNPNDPSSGMFCGLGDAFSDIYKCLKTGLTEIEKHPDQKEGVIQWLRIEFHSHIDRHLLELLYFLIVR